MEKDFLLIFDCDGTLVDSENLAAKLLVSFLNEKGIEANIKELVSNLSGISMQESLLWISKTYKIEIDDNFVSQFQKKLHTNYNNNLSPCLGVVEALKQIKNKMCVASNGPTESIMEAIKSCKLQTFFDNKIFSAYDVNKWKPEPDLFLHAAKMLNYEPAQCIVIEDSDVGLMAAKSASMKTVFFNPHKRETAFEYDYEIKNMVELLKLNEVKL